MKKSGFWFRRFAGVDTLEGAYRIYSRYTRRL